MTLRFPAPPGAVATALAALLVTAAATSTPASEIISTGQPSYRLTNTAAAGTPGVTKVVAEVVPPGTVVPTSPDVSPLTILPGSSGFAAENLKVLLGEGKTPTGGPLQALALDFGEAGFKPGGVLNFALSLDKAFQGSLQLVLPASAKDLEITTVPAAEVNGAGPSVDPAAHVPEPLSWLLWSAATGLCLLRARAYRRSHQAALQASSPA